MEVTLWGVRGSIPNPSQANKYYGANTSCLEARLNSGELLIFDAGTGIRSLSKTLPDHGECHIFLSHGHSDHVQGLIFFQPFFLPHWSIHLYLPPWLEDMPHRLFDGNSFPVSFSGLKAQIHLHIIRHGSIVRFGNGSGSARVEAQATNHPGGCLAYRLSADGVTLLFSGDHEITEDPLVFAATDAMLKNVDVAVVDAAYSLTDYQPGWGHSAWENWAGAAERAGVSTLLLTHHMPDRTDQELDALQHALLRKQASPAKNGTQIALAREGMRFILPGALDLEYKPSNWLQEFVNSLSPFQEETILLDLILHKTREMTNADAGSLYLVEGDDLVFAYAHNDALFPAGSRNKSAYISMRLPISMESIPGYAAATGLPLNLADVQRLPENAPYRSNGSFDNKTGCRTCSMLTLPIQARDRSVLGVLQLINSLNPRTGEPQPFSEPMRAFVQALVREAAMFLEISIQIKDNIKRLMKIAMLHDPSETGPHAERVGSLAAEIYHRWAEKKGIPLERIRRYKSPLRLAAMLHDIGKVGVSDLILKKPGKLTDEEFAVMGKHTLLGAGLFAANDGGITEMAHEISLHHHQKWNGGGYPTGEGKNAMHGESIPLAARLTAIADVFDALVSPRCYKSPWSFEQAETLLEQEAGKHFDPELVACFLEIKDTVALIYQRFPDKHEIARSPGA